MQQETVAVKRGCVSLLRFSDEFCFGVSVRHEPLLGSFSNNNKISIHRVSNLFALCNVLNDRPQRAIVRKHVQLISDQTKQIIDVDEKQERAKHTALRNSSHDSFALRIHSIDYNTLS